MDYENENHDASPNASSGKRKKSRGLKFFWGIFTSFSILANLVLLFLLFSVIIFFSAGRQDGFTETVVRSGDRSNRIAVISIKGVITDTTAEQFKKRIRIAARKDDVKAIIVNINSPGGAVFASEEIHHEITKFRNTGKPAIAYMNGLAASGASA